jgi:hypothetical protein
MSTIKTTMLITPIKKQISNSIKPGTLADRSKSKSMTIQFDSNANVDNRCYRVTDANFAVGGRRCIGYSNNANAANRRIADGSQR